MKVGILIDEYVSGSAPVLATQELRYLREEGFEAEILVGTRLVAKDYPKHESITFLVDKYPRFVEKFRFRFPFFSFFAPQHLLSAWFAPSVIRENDYDVIVAHGSFSALIAYSIRRKRNIPFITIFWDPSSYILPRVYAETFLRYSFFALVPLTKSFDVWISKNTDKLVLGSKFHLDWFYRQGIRDTDIVYPGCVPVDEPPKERGDFLLAVDRWDIGCTPDLFLEILRKAKHKFRIKIVGHWHGERLKDRFLTRVRESGMQNWVEVIGHVGFERLQQLFLEARCFVHPRREAFGMAALEAASCGCPIIIPAGSGVTDLFVHGKHGFFPVEGNEEAYSRYVEEVVTDAHLAYELGHSGWGVAMKYTWKHHAEQLGKVIKGTVQ